MIWWTQKVGSIQTPKSGGSETSSPP